MMTEAEILAVARDCAAWWRDDYCELTRKQLIVFARQVEAAERERCAKPCDTHRRSWPMAAFCAAIDRLSAALMGEDPIDMVLYCPNCGAQHVDAPEYANAKNTPAVRKGYEMGGYQEWTNPPHRSHLCHHCGHIWRPADVPTNGVQAVKTRGKNDSPICEPWRKRDGQVPAA